MPVRAKKVEGFNCPICGSPDFFECKSDFKKVDSNEDSGPEQTHYSCSGCSIVFMNPVEFGRRHTKTK